MSVLDLVLAKLSDVHTTSDGYAARCPAHDDSSPSLSVAAGDDGRVLLKCFAGCSNESIVDSIGLAMRDLFEPNARTAANDNGRSSGAGLTLERLAEAKNLPIEHLRALGWTTGRLGGNPCVCIPYERRDGQPARMRRRISLTGDRFRWAAKGKGAISAYEPDLGACAKAMRLAVLVEGETDCAAGRLAHLPVIGVPGADLLKVLLREHVLDVDRVFYVREPDRGGETFAEGVRERLRAIGFAGRLFEVVLGDAKDLCALHARDPEHFAEVVKPFFKDARRVELTSSTSRQRSLDEQRATDREQGTPPTEPRASPPSTSAPPTNDDAPDWRKGLACNDDGQVLNGVANSMHVLSLHPEWQGVLAFDAFREMTIKLKPPPVREQDGKSTVGEWTDADTARTQAWFATNIGFEPAPQKVENSIAAVGEKITRHEIRDYLGSLAWDGTERLPGMLHRYFGVTDSPYSRAVGARWMISAVARVMQPGCQVDCVLVLEGLQGAGKSTGFEALFSQAWFSDTPPVIGDKDSYQALRTKWLIEFADLDGLKGKEAGRVKRYIAARFDNFRESYGRRNRDRPRQCVFAGTTNEENYLTDHTGNRRFWPVRCVGRVDVAGLRSDRDQLWAEARVRYERGEPWHVNSDELRKLCEQEQRSRVQLDPWLDPVHRWLYETQGDDADQPRPRSRRAEQGVTTHDVLRYALQMKPREMTRDCETRAGQVLRELGWTPTRERDGSGGRVYRYRPAGFTAVDQPSRGEGWPTDTLQNKAQGGVAQPSQPNSSSNDSRGQPASHWALDDDDRPVVAAGTTSRSGIWVGPVRPPPEGIEPDDFAECYTEDDPRPPREVAE